MKRYKKTTPRVIKAKNLGPDQLVGHEDEKFTDVAVTFRSQVGELLHPGAESLKRLNVRQLLSVREFLLGPAEGFLDRNRIGFIHWQALTWRMAEACDAFQAECLEDAERWRGYAEDVSLDIEAPGWFALLGGAGELDAA